MQLLNALAWIAVILGAATATIILADEIARPQPMPIMNVVWPITGLYLPLVGLWCYYVMGRRMIAGVSQRQEAPGWHGVFVSATHCGSACALGDVMGWPFVDAFDLTLFGQPLFAEYLVEFLIAYVLGIAFQYFPIRTMRRISRIEAVKDAIEADTLALVAFEVGLFGWLALVTYVLLPLPLTTNSIVFWFIMQTGMVLGFVATYPINALLLRWGIKRGM